MRLVHPLVVVDYPGAKLRQVGTAYLLGAGRMVPNRDVVKEATGPS